MINDRKQLVQLPDFTDATLASLRNTVGVMGQREVLLDRLPQLQMPTLILWGIEDRLLPYTQAKEVSALVQDGSLELISNCGHLPYVEQANGSYRPSESSLATNLPAGKQTPLFISLPLRSLLGNLYATSCTEPRRSSEVASIRPRSTDR